MANSSERRNFDLRMRQLWSGEDGGWVLPVQAHARARSITPATTGLVAPGVRAYALRRKSQHLSPACDQRRQLVLRSAQQLQAHQQRHLEHGPDGWARCACFDRAQRLAADARAFGELHLCPAQRLPGVMDVLADHHRRIEDSGAGLDPGAASSFGEGICRGQEWEAAVGAVGDDHIVLILEDDRPSGRWLAVDVDVHLLGTIGDVTA